jgi:CheY-like chemotaxis protein
MSSERPTILCVDDEPSILRALRRVFIEEPWEVLLAESGAEGLAILEERDVELVLSDFRMPGMNGVEFLKRVKELRPDPVRVLLTGYADTDVIVSALNEGEIYRYINKPWNETELLDVVKKALEHGRLRRENVALGARLDGEGSALQALQLARQLIEDLPLAIFGLDADGVLVLANARARELDPRELDLDGDALSPDAEPTVEPLVVDDEVLGVVVQGAGMEALELEPENWHMPVAASAGDTWHA